MKNLSLQMFEYNFKENNKVELLFKPNSDQSGRFLKSFNSMDQAKAYARELVDFNSTKHLNKIDEHLIEMVQYVKSLEHMLKCAKNSYNLYQKIFDDISSIQNELNQDESLEKSASGNK